MLKNYIKNSQQQFINQAHNVPILVQVNIQALCKQRFRFVSYEYQCVRSHKVNDPARVAMTVGHLIVRGIIAVRVSNKYLHTTETCIVMRDLSCHPSMYLPI